ncbi:MAG: selenocysteine-specific translation elongation factor [Bryobacterales bacterium]|nr:selenocysteine-specific translation elongation factor [Bryobacterales bacterium]
MAADNHNVIVGTSGHIDHGKTSLVRALTGTDTDRWEEEKRRGITIDLGFASLRPEPGLRIGFVDVPGHERFVKNMLAGAGGIDVVMLVVAADESVMPQTREHFEICRLLGVKHGLIVLTKVDLVDWEILELVKLEVAEFVEGSFLADAPMLPVSSETGEGLEDLRAALAKTARRVAPHSSEGLLRLPIDRSFTMRGFGTVVTGTLASGRLRVDDTVEILPGHRTARIRKLQVHDESVKEATAGQRTAANLGGVAKAEIGRGMCIAPPGALAPSMQFDAHIELLRSARPLKHTAPVHIHLGTAETTARVYLLNGAGRRAALPPGESGYVQVRLANPLTAVHRDRFIIRQFSPLVTIAGGTVLDPHATRHRKDDGTLATLKALRTGSDEEVVLALCESRRFGIGGNDLTALTGRRESELARIAGPSRKLCVARQSPVWICSLRRIQQSEGRTAAAVQRYHRRNPLEPGIPIEELRSGEFRGAPPFFAELILGRLEAAGALLTDGDLVRDASHTVRLDRDEAEARNRLINSFEEAGLHVPTLKEFLPTLPTDARRTERILAALVREGVLVKVSSEFVFHSTAIEGLRNGLAPMKGAMIDVPKFKRLAGVSRKYAIPLLEYFDRVKVTLRIGNVRRVL